MRPEDMPDRGATKRDQCTNCGKRKLKARRRIDRPGMLRIWSECTGCGASQLSVEMEDCPSFVHNRPPGKGQVKKRERATLSD